MVVVSIRAWPSASWISCRSAPVPRSRDAKECRSTCGVDRPADEPRELEPAERVKAPRQQRLPRVAKTAARVDKEQAHVRPPGCRASGAADALRSDRRAGSRAGAALIGNSRSLSPLPCRTRRRALSRSTSAERQVDELPLTRRPQNRPTATTATGPAGRRPSGFVPIETDGSGQVLRGVRDYAALRIPSRTGARPRSRTPARPNTRFRESSAS